MRQHIILDNQLAELSHLEVREISGGDGFAHDIGTAIRFGLHYIKYGAVIPAHGIAMAYADYAANKAKCNCK
ncbi:hypothetical protein GGR92_001933 [Spirosoma lacussanchae]|uniref:hypothetical protein n=1 Tax=Spirosoma lacussanchae TaxID=1884249 RepID=UPI001108CC12|nr:hypothetical protein [Spirosoma lacussanchae]